MSIKQLRVRLLPLATYPLKVFGGNLALNLQTRRLNCLETTNLCPADGPDTTSKGACNSPHKPDYTGQYCSYSLIHALIVLRSTMPAKTPRRTAN
ncbi:hypothetical protein ACFWY6_36750 [Streptomyces sp. NPDC059037]|uniref:hypothetical protein n=1 Tax=Streptomyces sp. NPDC059037 TaxID=3346710 RepID=UPI0036C16AE3